MVFFTLLVMFCLANILILFLYINELRQIKMSD